MKIVVFTDSDLDGVVSYLVFKWFHPTAKIQVVNTTVTGFREEYTKWLGNHSPQDYDRIFILDLDVSEHKDLIDTPKHYIVDHHKTHVDNLPYDKATAAVKEYSSTAKLLYQRLSEIYKDFSAAPQITTNQKKLILLADDYDSYTLDLPESKSLNTVYWATQDRFKTFSKNFINGFKGFTLQQQNMIKMYNHEIKEIKQKLQVFGTETTINDTRIKILSAVASKHINEIANILLTENNADLAVVINLQTRHVSFRTNHEKINLISFVKKMCDNQGGGHAYAAGGPLTDTLMEFCKSLKPWKQ